MVKIAFHDNQLCERGTTVSLYDYAYYNKHLLGNESIIMYDGNDHRNVKEVIEKFSKEFQLHPYTNWKSEANNILKRENCDILYMIKAGGWDGKIAANEVCKTVIHCVFQCNSPHGDIYASIAPWVDYNNGRFPFVPHIINLPNHNENMKEELNIPQDALVFGRFGGFKQFDIKYVQNCVYEYAKMNPENYFLFVNTEKFCDDMPNIIHLNKIIDLHKKTKFINTCDAMIWGRSDGEIYSLSQGEFSVKNKPVICCKTNYNNGHLHKLKEKALWFSDEKSLLDIFNNFKTYRLRYDNWNCYEDSTPENVMNTFNEIFIKPCLNMKKQEDIKSYHEHNKQYIENEAYNREKEIHNQKTKSAELKDGGIWDNLYKPGYLQGIWLEKNIKINQSVDIGCGSGWFVNYLNSKYNFPVNKIYGIEPSQGAIDIAKKIYPDTASKINYICGFAENELLKINLNNEPTLFTTFIVLSHIEDLVVIKILESINKVAPTGSVLIFTDNYGPEFHNKLWHSRTKEWWQHHLHGWKLQYDKRPRPDLNNYYAQGIYGIKL